jgi:hypothetical protein
MKNWNNSSLGMYVDNGIIFACMDTWDNVQTLLQAHFTVCNEWLRRAGLVIEPDKTELLFFQKPYEHNPMPSPTLILLPDQDRMTYYSVSPVDTLH